MVSTDDLKKAVVFQNLTEDQLKKIAALSSEKGYSVGTVLYREGDPADKFYVVQEGKVTLVMKSDLGPNKPPLQVTVDVITKGESMGWSGIVEPYFFTLSCLCIDDSKLIEINAPKLRELLENDKTLGFQVMKSIAKLIASRLTHTRIILVGERGISLLSDY